MTDNLSVCVSTSHDVTFKYCVAPTSERHDTTFSTNENDKTWQAIYPYAYRLEMITRSYTNEGALFIYLHEWGYHIRMRINLEWYLVDIHMRESYSYTFMDEGTISECVSTWNDTSIDLKLRVSFAYRVAKTHRMPYLSRSFSAKEPYD